MTSPTFASVPHYAVDWSYLTIVIDGQRYGHRRVHISPGPHCETCDIPPLDWYTVKSNENYDEWLSQSDEWDRQRTQAHRDRNDTWWESNGLTFCSTCLADGLVAEPAWAVFEWGPHRRRPHPRAPKSREL